jgi:hypothetical protein
VKLLFMVEMVLSALTKPRQHIRIEEIPPGRVIDIGGGGEGVIAQVGSKYLWVAEPSPGFFR